MTAKAATDARLLASVDLASLGEDDAPEKIRGLCARAVAERVRPAAVCVYPEHIATARAALNRDGASGIRVAAVANFPDGANDAARALRETRRALAAGADEIDLVFPWRAWTGGDRDGGPLMVERCKEACGHRTLKAIIESGELGDPLLVREVSLAAIDAGADFVKTSTGRSRVGATIEAAAAILECLRERGRGGIKASGGIRTLADARGYLELADRVCGAGWATPATFRIGTSALLGGDAAR
jgi:deoxyribose-phosphate aldolase